MQDLLKCERCLNPYSLEDRQPLIMPDCGHSFCEFCVAEILTGNPKQCPNDNCGKPVKTKDLERFYKNQQLLHILENLRNNRYAQEENSTFARAEGGYPLQTGQFTSCTRHIDKKVEYFCKTCSDTVCARCIFDEHNGHELVQIEDMATSLKQNVLDLQKMILNASRLNEENSKLLD